MCFATPVMLSCCVLFVLIIEEHILLRMDQKHYGTSAKLSELVETFYKFDPRYTGTLKKKDILPALQNLGCKISDEELSEAFKAADMLNSDSEISLNDFKRIYQEVCKHDPRRSTIEKVASKQTVYQYGGACAGVNDDTIHSVSEEEQVAFSSWIERNLKDDPSCSAYFPFEEEGGDIYQKCRDGILLCKIINCSVPATIDSRALNLCKNPTTFQMHENITLALNSARAIGCNVVNIGASDILDGTKHLLLGLLWQIIKIGLLKQINVVAHAELATLLEGDETISEFARLSPEDILIRWVNYHLKGTESGTRMHNFTADVRNCEVYAYLVEQIAPKEKRPFMHSTKAILDAVDLVQRAEMVLQNAEQLDCRVFVRPQDIVSGSQRLNLAFLANLFHGYPALEKPPDVEEKVAEIEETREEKTYRNWINSMGIVPAVNYLFSDLTDGLTLLKLFDLVKKRSVDWSRVNSDLCKATAKINFQCLENCNYAVNLGRQFGFSLVGLGGEDIQQGKRTMTLALLWQLMRAYTLSVLTRLTEAIPILHDRQQKAGRSPPISETEIIHWTNEKLRQCGKTSRISDAFGFADPALATGHTVIDLIDAIRPGSVDYSAVLLGMTRQERLTNAQYAIPLARRIGATVYAVPEDIVELKPKMIMTIFACLMTAALDGVCGVDTPKMNAANSGEGLEYLDLNGSKRSHLPAGDSRAGQVIEGPITGRPARNTFSTMWYPSLKEIERPDLNRVYVKTVCFTLSNTKGETQTGNSTLFTTGGGAGDCTENPISHCENKEEQSILHDMHSKRSDTHSQFDSACKRNVNIEKSRLTDSISDCYTKMDKVPGPCPTPFSEKLSRPVPSIFIIDEETTEDADMLCSIDSSRTMRKFVPKISYDNTTSICALDSHIPRHITEMAGGENVNHLNVVRETLESETSHVCRRREHNTNRSHGGGRLFIATKSKK